MGCSLPGSSVHGILQARVLEWVAISFSRGSSWPRDRTHVSHIVGRHFTFWATRESQTNVLKEEEEVKVAQSYLTLCDPMDYTIHGILQARILEWVAFPFFRGSSQPRDRTQVSLTADGFFNSWATREAHSTAAAAAAKSLQSCPTLCDPTDGSPPGSSIHGILQARTLEWVAISFSNAWKWKVKVKSLSRVRLLATPWTATYQAPQSMGFSRQEYWSGVPLPSLAHSTKPYLIIINHALKGRLSFNYC